MLIPGTERRNPAPIVTDLTSHLVRHLREALGSRVPATVTDELAQRAAVAVIVSDEADPGLLFLRRSEREGDPWSGHVALPGGFFEERDGSAAATAERETEEETGIALARVGERLGVLDDVAPRSVLLPRVTVTPVVFAVPERLLVRPGPEVAAAAWLPVAAVLDPASRRPLELDLPGGRRVFEAIEVGSYTIWGLTERVLAQLPPLLPR